MSKIKVASREKQIEVVCSRCGSTYAGFRQRSDSKCNLCLKLHYKESNAKARAIKFTQQSKDEYKILKSWIRRSVTLNLKANDDEKEKIVEQMLEKLISQDFKCFYTGLPLVPGVNASIEHIKPKSKNPELRKDVNNLVWIRTEVNSMRNNYTFEKFLMLCDACIKSPVLQNFVRIEQAEAYEDYCI